MSIAEAFPVAICGLAVLCLVTTRDRVAGVVWIAKPVAAACLLWAAWEWQALDSPYGRKLICGLMLCVAGDLMLIPHGRGVPFLAGLTSFLLGHVAYALAFLEWPVSRPALLVAGCGLVAAAGLTLRWLGPHATGRLLWPVRAYVLVIACMVTLAVATHHAGAPASAALGAVGFALSDLAVARERFVAPSAWNGRWGLPLYFGSQLLISRSALTAAPG